MLENFSPQAIRLIEDAEAIAKLDNKPFIGTEDLLLAMFNVEDTICHFLLGEEQITKDELEEEIKNLNVKSITNTNSKFTPKFNEIVKFATDAIKIFNSDYVYDEHLFYSLLNNPDNNGVKVLINLGIDPEIMIQDILDIFNVEKKVEEPDFLTNLTTLKETHPYILRSNQIERLEVILHKKQKNNPMLIGSAGVGKTALVEAYAKLHPEKTIYRFDLGVVIAGTKYRGELEEKIIAAMDFIKKQDAILFIDEIHNIVGAGSNEGTLDIANILKPYLARSDIRCIGSTTLDEYYKYIEKDKALMRRFHNIFINEPSINEVKNILSNIKSAYEDYHNIDYSEECIDYIIDKTDKFLPQRTFPDKAIDVLDELGSRINLIQKEDSKKDLVDSIIKDLNGISFNKNLDSIKLNVPLLKSYYQKYLESKENSKPIVSISVSSTFKVDSLILDLENVSNFKKENYLEIDLETYNDASSINNLIGSTKGYIGYESGGILSEHIIKYPFSLVYIINFDKACDVVQNFIKKLLKTNYFLDNKGRKVVINNSIFIIETNNSFNNSIGFLNKNRINSNIINCDIRL